MLPIPTRKLFRSRWWALAWAAGVCWTAVDIADSNSHQSGNAAANGGQADDGDGNVAQVAAILHGF